MPRAKHRPQPDASDLVGSRNLLHARVRRRSRFQVEAPRLPQVLPWRGGRLEHKRLRRNDDQRARPLHYSCHRDHAAVDVRHASEGPAGRSCDETIPGGSHRSLHDRGALALDEHALRLRRRRAFIGLCARALVHGDLHVRHNSQVHARPCGQSELDQRVRCGRRPIGPGRPHVQGLHPLLRRVLRHSGAVHVHSVSVHARRLQHRSGEVDCGCSQPWIRVALRFGVRGLQHRHHLRMFQHHHCNLCRLNDLWPEARRPEAQVRVPVRAHMGAQQAEGNLRKSQGFDRRDIRRLS
mmetsp:Transcript_88437/g.255176  ORF Transcript_88437/g.255176 Transcript_88437/m.255176 type:complete len:295 (+) Transcript_88437:664-1548(+)